MPHFQRFYFRFRTRIICTIFYTLYFYNTCRICVVSFVFCDVNYFSESVCFCCYRVYIITKYNCYRASFLFIVDFAFYFTGFEILFYIVWSVPSIRSIKQDPTFICFKINGWSVNVVIDYTIGCYYKRTIFCKIHEILCGKIAQQHRRNIFDVH